MAAADTFTTALGTGRGPVGNMTELRLAETSRELNEERAQRRELEESLIQAREDLSAAQAIQANLKSDTKAEIRKRKSAERRHRKKLRSVLSDALYAVLREHGSVPVSVGKDFLDQHCGTWRPTRPYLPHAHVFMELGMCFRAGDVGAAAAAEPGSADCWTVCPDPQSCPKPVAPNLESGFHPISNGFALRQDKYWWEGSGRRWEIDELGENHLTAIFPFLQERVDDMVASEDNSYTTYTPSAYESPEHWLEDTPVMRALSAEAARRRQVRQDRAAASGL